ncbi:MAG TPA: DUF6799 domain-containing protein [Chitinophagaceae bacterium]|nr:DUF6799 domain-containing protein [Chitinophagaceae bacterium]
MKKLFAILSITVLLAACSDSATKTDTTATDSTGMMKDTSTMITTPPPMETMNMKEEGLMTMKDGKMMMMKDGNWVAMDKTITCTDGCKVMTDGHVMMKDGKKMMMTEGMMINKDGKMMDKDGKMMDMKM